ncbi:MAG: flavodoxin family protein [Roseburia sp.]
MQIEVRYQSRGGNTKAVAEMIAKEFQVSALSIDHPVKEYTDILFLGGGVYGWKMDKSLCEFIKQLPKEKVGQIVAFSTTGLMESTLKQIRQEAEQKGIRVNQNELLIKMMLRGHSMLGLEGGNLTKEQQEKVQEFVKVIQREMER